MIKKFLGSWESDLKDMSKILNSLRLKLSKVNQTKVSLEKDGANQFEPKESIFKSSYSELVGAQNNFNRNTIK